jgi:hypothetical protein
MAPAFLEGRGQLRAGERHICDVSYELHVGEPEETAFTQTDGLLTLEAPLEEVAAIQEELEPYDEMTLVLAEPLADGRTELSIRIEPYAGHRPDERLQVRVLD